MTDLADALISGDTPISGWDLSDNTYDWLGRGIYFWEYGPERAREWSLENGRDGGVVGAIIQLGKCLDLTDTRSTDFLSVAYDSIVELYAVKGTSLPANRQGWNELDCLVINEANDSFARPGFQTVRCPFLEGGPAFPGSKIRRKSHIQIAVIDRSCIVGVFRPTLDYSGDIQ